jgi:hypothetical protein
MPLFYQITNWAEKVITALILNEIANYIFRRKLITFAKISDQQQH